jgi:hypothetical protein
LRLAGPSTRRDLKALRNLINQVDLSLASFPNIHPSHPPANPERCAGLIQRTRFIVSMSRGLNGCEKD